MHRAYFEDTGGIALEIKSLDRGFIATMSEAELGAYNYAVEGLVKVFCAGQHAERHSPEGPGEVDFTGTALSLVKGIAWHLASGRTK